MTDVFQELIAALETEDRVMLATIISSSGSTPASAFSKMLIMSSGTVPVGTVGGGCMEGDVIQAAQRLFRENRTEILTFHLNEDEFVQGLICGGTVDVLVEPVGRREIPLYQRIMKLREEGEDCVVATLLGSDGMIRFKIILEGENSEGMNGLMDEWSSSIQQSPPPSDHARPATPFGRVVRADERPKAKEQNTFGRAGNNPVIQSDLSDELRKSLHRNETRRIAASNGELILEPISGTPALVIFGGGHVSKYISKAAAMAGFRVKVVDDREQYANPARFPEAARTLAVDFANAFDKLAIKPSTFIVIVTRGHRYDEDILELAVKTPAKYIGMIGSKRKVLTTYEHLVARGIAVDELKRVHAPMGIGIGATTAEEIGVSVTAQLIAVRREESAPYADKSDAMQALFARLKTMGTVHH